MINNLNTSTPQLKAVGRFYQAYRTCDLNNIAPILSKDFTYRPFPKLPGLGDWTKEEHLESFGPMLAKLVKLEERIPYQGIPFGFPWLKFAILARLPRSNRSARKGRRKGLSLDIHLLRFVVQ